MLVVVVCTDTATASLHGAPALAPSLTPAAQPTISLLSDTNTDSLSVDSLTLLPPADPPCLHRFSRDEATPSDPGAPTTPNPETAEDVSDTSATLEENSKPDHLHSEPANVSEPDLSSKFRQKVETEISAPDSEESQDVEQETEID
ncbi:Protein CLEC16A [Bagarius yarrelli]|uniref:Protein CLEC16A n=1 Tax=Bagarius yarrelli TaxID=175774 RepID=A0A556VXC1_BAGYA|nr:Protein CLEC16A [Bagarius yarrelli]